MNTALNWIDNAAIFNWNDAYYFCIQKHRKTRMTPNSSMKLSKFLYNRKKDYASSISCWVFSTKMQNPMTLKLNTFDILNSNEFRHFLKPQCAHSILLRSIDNVVFWISILIKVSPSNNTFGNLNRADEQNQPQQTATSSSDLKKNSIAATKKLPQTSSLGCKDKIYDAKYEFKSNNNKEFDVAASVSHHDPFNNRNAVDATNRLTSRLM